MEEGGSSSATAHGSSSESVEEGGSSATTQGSSHESPATSPEKKRKPSPEYGATDMAAYSQASEQVHTMIKK